MTASVSGITILDHHVCKGGDCKHYPAHSVACILCQNPTSRTHQCGKAGRHNNVIHETSDKVVHAVTGVARHARCSTCSTAAQQQPQQPMPIEQPPLPKQSQRRHQHHCLMRAVFPALQWSQAQNLLPPMLAALQGTTPASLVASSMLDVPSAVAEATASSW